MERSSRSVSASKASHMTTVSTDTCRTYQSQRSKRGKWGSDLQFILTCIGYSVGLGNVWRFPLKAYENGGAAFLIPYLISSMVIGFPLIFLEMSLGQFTNSGPGTIFGKLCPLLHGIGWGQVAMSFIAGIYYNVIVAWTLIYLGYIVAFQWSRFARCDNKFNNAFCYSDQMREAENIGNFTGNWYYYNKQANDAKPENLSTYENAATQFFTKNVLMQSTNIDDPGHWNWLLFGGLLIAWVLTALSLIKGVKYIGRIAYVTATLPYIVICILFIRGVSLPGAFIGIEYYLLKPNYSKLLEFETWKQAALHVCFSLGAGFGGLISLSSFNERSHNCFRDAAIVTVADAFMSVFGGTAVFSVLGFMAHQTGRKIEDVVDGGIGLAFIAYPEAMSQMPAPYIWAFLFFAMLFTLGISSQFGYAEVCCTAICDQFPKLRKKRAFVVMGVCGAAFLIGLIFCHGAGLYWFHLFNEHMSSFSLMYIIALEMIVVNHIYGYRNFKKDLISMFGIRPKGFTWWSKTKWVFSNVFGRKGLYVAYMMIAICPAVYLALGTYAMYGLVSEPEKYGKDTILAGWAKVPAVILAAAGIVVMFGVGIGNVVQFRRNGKPWRSLITPQRDWPNRKLLVPVDPPKVEGWSSISSNRDFDNDFANPVVSNTDSTDNENSK
ncbi:hypothetical protein L596_006840 [Steinernema carpocapsae]|uniref:Transporter n=1 Tax=Steinernema carpocapsae TaxID=34508 RepID=A0A4U5P776_STECR|nr:hypothetical protein L596_006840 [Steinernema carpocapsae]